MPHASLLHITLQQTRFVSAIGCFTPVGFALCWLSLLILSWWSNLCCKLTQWWFVAMQTVRKSLRALYRQRAVISVKATQRGIKEIDQWHAYAKFKFVSSLLGVFNFAGALFEWVWWFRSRTEAFVVRCRSRFKLCDYLDFCTASPCASCSMISFSKSSRPKTRYGEADGDECSLVLINEAVFAHVRRLAPVSDDSIFKQCLL